MTDLYTESDAEVIRTYRRTHANGEQTHVAILSCGKRSYVAVAYDLDPTDYSPLAADAVAYDPTIEGVTERTERWLETHAKGVAPGGESESGDGGRDWKQAFINMAKKLNEYGNRQRDQMQQNQGGDQ